MWNIRKFCAIGCCLALAGLFLFSGCGHAPDATTPPSSVTPKLPAAPAPSILAQEGYLKPEIARITAEELFQLARSGQDYVLIDTRQESLFKEGHIAGAVNIHFVSANGAADDATRAAWLGLPPERLKIFYCDCPHDETSSQAAFELLSSHYPASNIKVLWKGYFHWQELGYPVGLN
jgi:rhodanese-related sulfurtransferase